MVQVVNSYKQVLTICIKSASRHALFEAGLGRSSLLNCTAHAAFSRAIAARRSSVNRIRLPLTIAVRSSMRADMGWGIEVVMDNLGLLFPT
jgi:hypothetical protein